MTRVRLAITLRQAAEEVAAGQDLRLLVRYRGQELDVRTNASSGTVVVSAAGWAATFDAATVATHAGVIDKVVPAVEAAVDRANQRVWVDPRTPNVDNRVSPLDDGSKGAGQ